MPELPEVECLTRAVREILEGGVITSAKFLRPNLRDQIPVDDFNRIVVGSKVESVFRRSKYLLIRTKRGHGVIHLGMTGNLLLQPSGEPRINHTHAVFCAEDRRGNSLFLHYVDPRRFGRIACVAGADLEQDAMFSCLGVEPLAFPNLAEHLFLASRRRKQPIKTFLMDARIVVGVGNIYASESLFRAGIKPQRAAGTVPREKFDLLAKSVQKTLAAAIAAGGTTFRDYRNSDGNPGYFAVRLSVYGRTGEPCRKCGAKVREMRQSGRSTFYCAICQN